MNATFVCIENQCTSYFMLFQNLDDHNYCVNHDNFRTIWKKYVLEGRGKKELLVLDIEDDVDANIGENWPLFLRQMTTKQTCLTD